jgi:hypothetical protein
VGGVHTRWLRMEETHCAAAGSYPWSMGHHKMRSEWRTQTILSVSKEPQKSSFSVWRESWPMWVMARKAVCLVSKGPADRVVTYVSITWQLGTLLKPSDPQQFCWRVWLN